MTVTRWATFEISFVFVSIKAISIATGFANFGATNQKFAFKQKKYIS